MSDILDLIDYLEANLTDPSNRGYPLSTGLTWIYTHKPQFELKAIGYPIIFTSLSSPSFLKRNRARGSVMRNTITLNVYSDNPQDLDNIQSQLMSLSKTIPENTVVDGAYDWQFQNSSINNSVLQNEDIYLLSVTLSYLTCELG